MTVAFAELGARTNFTLLDGASHPAEMVATAAVLGHAGIGVCDTQQPGRGGARACRGQGRRNSASSSGHGWCSTMARPISAWPTDRESYGRLTKLLSLGRMRAPKGQCQISRAEMLDHAEGWVMAAIPPAFPDAAFAARLQGRCARPAGSPRDAAALLGARHLRRRRPPSPGTLASHGAPRRAPGCWPRPTPATTIPTVAASPTC